MKPLLGSDRARIKISAQLCLLFLTSASVRVSDFHTRTESRVSANLPRRLNFRHQV